MAEMKVKKSAVVKTSNKESYKVKSESLDLFVEIDKINKRIDRIVFAIDKSKKVRGL